MIKPMLQIVRGIVKTTPLPLQKITEAFSPEITFEGRTFGLLSDTAVPQWQIKKTNVDGIETKEQFVASGAFNQIWDNRVSLFPFVNSTSLLLDGVDEHLDLPNAANIDFIQTSTFSWSVWFKKNGSATTMNFCQKNLGSGGSNNMIRLYAPTNNRVSFQIRATGSGDRLRVRTQSLSGVIDDNNWHHAALTYNGSSLGAGALIYIDGALGTMDTQNDTLSNPITPGDDWKIGTQGNATGSFWNGNFDEISIWNKVLSLVEIQEIYNLGMPAGLQDHSAFANMVSSWSFNNSNNFPNPVDSKGGNPLTMVNMEAGDYVPDIP